MNTSEPEGYEATSKHFKLYDDDESSDTDSDSDTETESGSESGTDHVNVGMLKGLSLIHISEPTNVEESRMPSSA